MNNKKYKITMGTIAGLMVLSGGLFAYQNVYVAKQQEANKATIYVAKEDIQAHSAITADMFIPLQIDNTSVLRGYVLDVNSVVGKELKGGLLQGEPLTQQRLEAKGSNKEGNLTLKVVPDTVGDIKGNDNVKIYVELTDKDSGAVSVKELFANKKVIKEEKSENSLLSQNKDDKSGSFNIQATEKEATDYFVAKDSGKILVVKINELDTNKISSDAKSKEKFDANSEEVKNASKQSDQSGSEGQAIQTYTVKKGDTLESLSLKFKTKKETISALNNNKETFKVGEMIQVPAN